MKLSDMKGLIIYFNLIKSLILICLMENRLVEAEYSKQILCFFKILQFCKKKNTVQTSKKYKRINITHFCAFFIICGICLCE